VLAAIDRDIGAGHERRPARAQVDDNLQFLRARRGVRAGPAAGILAGDSPDDSRTGVNIIAFPSSLEDRREVRTATGTLGQPERVVERPIWPFSLALARFDPAGLP
jgi:hypothetical protein